MSSVGPNVSQRSRRPYNAPFKASVEVRFDGCHIWTGALTGAGYGNYWHPEKKINVPAHVYAWEKINGPVPDGYELHHKCRVRPCVAWDHLELLTPAEHRREHFREQTHCKRDHELTPENTYIRDKGNGVRQCRRCHADAEKARRATRG